MLKYFFCLFMFHFFVFAQHAVRCPNKDSICVEGEIAYCADGRFMECKKLLSDDFLKVDFDEFSLIKKTPKESETSPVVSAPSTTILAQFVLPDDSQLLFYLGVLTSLGAGVVVLFHILYAFHVRNINRLIKPNNHNF